MPNDGCNKNEILLPNDVPYHHVRAQTFPGTNLTTP